MIPGKDSVTLWRIPELGGIDLVRSRYGAHAFAPHSHEEYMLGVVESGVEGVRYRGCTEFAPAGNLMMVNPGEVHTGFPANGTTWAYRGMYPSVAAVQQIANDLGYANRLPFFSSATQRDAVTAARLLAMHRQLETSVSSLERESLVVEGLSLLIRRHADHQPDDRPPRQVHRAVATARALLDERPHEELPLAALSDATGLSRFHLIRVFRAGTGLSPHQYQTLRRVQLARRLLLRGCSPSDAAAQAGFCDQSHLTRSFQKIQGVTPGAAPAAAAGACTTASPTCATA